MKHYMSKDYSKYLIVGESEKEKALIDKIFSIVDLFTDLEKPEPLPSLKHPEYCHSCEVKQIQIPE